MKQNNYRPFKIVVEFKTPIPTDSDRSGILYQALYVLVQRLITSLTKCQTRCCIEPRPSVDDQKASAVFEAEAEKHRRNKAAAAKRYKRKARCSILFIPTIQKQNAAVRRKKKTIQKE